MHTDILYALKSFNDHLPHKNWFIAGGCAASDVFNDIDVYFHSMEDYNKAISTIQRFNYSTNNGVTFDLVIEDQVSDPSTKQRTIQFIKRHVGDHISVVESFDLNKSRAVIFPDGSRYYHPSFTEPLHFSLASIHKDTIFRFGKYINLKHFIPHPDMVPLMASLLAVDTIVVEDYYEGKQLKAQVVPISQVKHYNDSDTALQFIIDAINLLQPTDRINRFTYLFQRWYNKRPPISDTSSTEFLYAHHKVYSTPIHPRIIAENPEYLI